MGAFVLPNAIIPDEAPLESFVVPGLSSTLFHYLDPLFLPLSCSSYRLVDAVERAAGLTLFSDALKASSKHICKTTPCQLIIRKFDESGKLVSEGPGGASGGKRKGSQQAISAPPGGK